MGRKRKRIQTKGTTSSKKQKKRRKMCGKGFNHSDNITKEVDVHVSEVMKPSNSSGGKQSLASPHCSKKLRSCGKSTIFSPLASFVGLFQRPTLERFRSIRSVFILLDWLKQIFGCCRLQTLGKFLLEKDNLRLMATDRGSNHMHEDVVRRMENLEEEVKFLKTELIKKSQCSCGKQPTASNSAEQGSLVPSTSAPAPPPPPPPPPPPVLPPPPPPLAFLKNNQAGLKGKGPKETKTMPDQRTNLVTLEDLKKVKLRTVNKENLQPDCETKARRRAQPCDEQPKETSLKRPCGQKKDLPQCVISLKEIKKVTLKRTKIVENEVEKIRLRTPEEMVVMRRNLRKVNITRSPGGTPLGTERNYENGTGLTPMMTKALRRKFQQAHPKCSPESPKALRRKRQSFSPLADHSPNTPSPLLTNRF